MRYLALLWILVLTACQEPEPPLRIGTNVWTGYEPLYLARFLGQLSAENTRLLEFTSASQVIDALEYGSIDAAALTLDEALLLLHQGIKVKLVLVMDVSTGGDALLAQPWISKLTELKGKTIGLEDTALGAYMLTRILELSQLSIEDIHLKPLEANAHEESFSSGQVDAVVSFDPIRTRLMAQGARVLFDSRQLPNEIIDVLVVRADRANQSRRHLRQLLHAWFASLALIEQQPDRMIEAMQPRLKLDQNTIHNMLTGLNFPSRQQNVQWLLCRNPTLTKQIAQMHRIMQQHHLVVGDVSMTEFLDQTLIKRLYQ